MTIRSWHNMGLIEPLPGFIFFPPQTESLMFKHYYEAREMRQLRKAQAALQKRQQLFILVGILVVLMVVISVSKALMPTEPAKSAVSKPNPRVVADIQEYADVVTKPLETLTQRDLDLVTRRENDPCYAKYVGIGLNREQIAAAITVCKSP